MAVTVTVSHSTVVTLPDEPGAEVNKDQWNGTGAHTVVVNGLGALATQDTVTSAQISDATATGKSVLTAVDAAAARTAIGAGTGSGTVTSVSGTAPIASSGGATPAISLNDAGVTYAKIQNVSATDKVLGRSTAGAGVVEEIALTAAGRALIDDADATAQRTTLGLGTLATQSGTFSGTSSGTNTGDQTSIAGITGTLAQFNTACTDADFASGGGTATGTNTGDQTISDATITTTDITTNDVSTAKHGFAPKAPNDSTKFLRGDATWAVPTSSGISLGLALAVASNIYMS